MTHDEQQDGRFDDQVEVGQEQDGAADPAADPPADEPIGQDEEPQRAGSGIMGWAISATVHGTLIAVMGLVYFATQQPDEDIPPVRVTQIEPPPKKEERPKERRELTPKIEINAPEDPTTDKVAPVTALELPDEQTSREEDTDNPLPKGREEAMADSEMGSTGLSMAIGAGSGASGMWGFRSGGGKKRAIAKGGGNAGGEKAVDGALRWLKRHQSPNGMWEAVNYPVNCAEDPKCEPGKDMPGATVALTSYAVMCFLGAGYDHKTPNRFKQTVRKGIDYLVSVQKPDGLIGDRNYENAIAAMALADAYGMTGDAELRAPAQKAIDVILKRQNRAKKDDPYGGLGWDYVGPNDRNDSSVTGWNVMALKNGLSAGLNVGNGLDGAKTWLERAWKATNPNWAKLTPYDQSRFPYTWNTASNAVEISAGPANAHDMASVGMMTAVYLGHRAGDTLLETLGNYVIDHQLPRGWPTNTYYMYYNTYGVFQLGGDRWKKWNGTVLNLLVDNQRRGEGCLDGSWDWQGSGFHGNDVGRVLSTVYCCLCLEVYYRFAHTEKGKQKGL